MGKFLRKTGLDELPQLINVLKGNMSLVAPRRNDLSFDEWMKLDLSYIDNWSLQTDFMLLFKTAGTVLTGAGR